MLALHDRRHLPVPAENSAAGKRSGRRSVEAGEETGMRMKVLSLAALGLLAGCADGPAPRQETGRRALAEARPAGDPVDCIDLARIDRTRVRDGRTIDFHLRGRQVYRNRLPAECPGLAFESFSYRPSAGRLCSLDLITVNRSGGGLGGPSCALGPFQRIETSLR
jgi:hypothetical protein